MHNLNTILVAAAVVGRSIPHIPPFIQIKISSGELLKCSRDNLLTVNYKILLYNMLSGACSVQDAWILGISQLQKFSWKNKI